MTSGPLTLANLRKAGVITSREIVAAIDAYMLDPAAGPYLFSSGHSLDIAAIVGTTSSLERMERAGPQENAFRIALATTIMAAHPTTP
ncbi:hypothetical protein MRF4_20695 [Methylobacterium radiotolerans]|uniref:hypothetical protein n=1 Tax=Methylobacterium TaxID=407 RepID=UPI002F334A82